MELHQVRYFLALAQSLNFTRAAEQCNVTQPALTKAIQKLEHELGGDLIYRERQLTQLTDLGKLVLPTLEATLAAADAVRLHAREFQDKSVAPLRVGLAPCISAALVAAPLADIARHMPGLQVELVEAQFDQLVEMLLDGQINAAIAGDDSDDLPSRIDVWRLFSERFNVLTAAAGPLAGINAIPVEQLVQLTWLEHLGCETVRRFWQARQPHGDQPRVSHRSRHVVHLQHMVEAGLGVMLLPEHAPALPALVRRPIVDDPIRREILLLVVSGRQYSPALDAFVKIARTRDWHTGNDAESDRLRRPVVPPVAGKPRCRPTHTPLPI